MRGTSDSVDVASVVCRVQSLQHPGQVVAPEIENRSCEIAPAEPRHLCKFGDLLRCEIGQVGRWPGEGRGIDREHRCRHTRFRSWLLDQRRWSRQLLDQVTERLDREGLVQHRVHACRAPRIRVVTDDMRGHCDDRDTRLAVRSIARTNDPGRLEPSMRMRS